jgi:hypothetical protein
MYNTMMRKSIQGFVREFDDDQDVDCIRTGMIAIREAQTTMDCGLTERSNPSASLA